MKLERPKRVNRSTRAGEVLRTPEQTHILPWDPRDPELFAHWLERAENVNYPQQGYVVFGLSVMPPHGVRPEIRAAVVEKSIVNMQSLLQIWQKGRQDENFGLGSFAQHMLPALLLDPRAHLEAPKKFWAEIHELMQDKDYWYRNYLRAYALQFPGRLDSRSNEVFEHLYTQFERHQQRSGDTGHELLADLGTMRMVTPGRFSDVQLTQTDRHIIQTHLRQLRTEVEGEDGPWGSYPEELFLAMVALADEVTLSPERGLQLEFATPSVASTPSLPERPGF